MRTTRAGGLDFARMVADAVLYEGYLLYPYRASSDKNRSRWQFGVLGPEGASEAGVGEAAGMRMQTVVTTPAAGADAVVHLRFLRSQLRQVLDPAGHPVERAVVDGEELLTWEEAVEYEHVVHLDLNTLGSREVEHRVRVEGDEDTASAAIIRRRWPLEAVLTARLTTSGPYAVLDVEVRNTVELELPDRTEATHHSLIGAHLLIEADGFEFVSMTDPPEEVAELVATCRPDLCWPLLSGAAPRRDLLLGSPIILYDYPEIAPESAGALFDSTEIDEILTLRVMTMTEAEKTEARATDPRARAIIDRCDEMTPEGLEQLHGILRNPHAGEPDVYPEPQWPGATEVSNLAPTSFETGDVPWWSPEADERVNPGLDSVVIDGVSVARDSFVRVHPKRRADAQDLFFNDQVARVMAVLSDVDGGTHVALVLADDPAADLHDLAGRYWYFAPHELEPLPADPTYRKESS